MWLVLQLLWNGVFPLRSPRLIISPQRRCCAIVALTEWEADVLSEYYEVTFPTAHTRPRLPVLCLVMLLWEMEKSGASSLLVDHFRNVFERGESWLVNPRSSGPKQLGTR